MPNVCWQASNQERQLKVKRETRAGEERANDLETWECLHKQSAELHSFHNSVPRVLITL